MAMIPVEVSHNDEKLEAKDVKIQIKNGDEIMVDTNLQSLVHKFFQAIEQNIQMGAILNQIAEKERDGVVVANEQQLRDLDGRKQK